MSESPVLGIDLGTTNSCIAIWQIGKVKILPNQFNQNTTPSCVGFTGQGILIGQSAVNQQCANPKNTIFEAKRVIGLDHKTVERNMKYLPFHMSKDDADRQKYNVQLEGEANQLFPEEISAIILKQLKEDAAKFIGQVVSST